MSLYQLPKNNRKNNRTDPDVLDLAGLAAEGRYDARVHHSQLPRCHRHLGVDRPGDRGVERSKLFTQRGRRARQLVVDSGREASDGVLYRVDHHGLRPALRAFASRREGEGREHTSGVIDGAHSLPVLTPTR